MNNPVRKTINMKLPKLEIKRFSGDPKITNISKIHSR